MERAFGWLYSRLGPRYLQAILAFEVASALLICLATVGIIGIYVDIPTDEFWRIVAFGELCVAVALLIGARRIAQVTQPLVAWIRGARGPAESLAAWSTAVAVPGEFVMRSIWRSTLLVCLPTAIFTTIELDLPAYNVAILFAAALVALAYSAVLHFFASEAALRPVVADISRTVSIDGRLATSGVPLSWKLLGALPLINVFTGVVVAGLSQHGRASVSDLGTDVIVAVFVAFTVSLELTLLVTRSVLAPVGNLLAATERVKRGDLSTRVPVVSGDELGALAGSFNDMVEGLAEREALHDAFGSYVDPGVARRVLEEGALLAGEEVEVSIVFVDIRDFTSFAERSSARETVHYLNEFFDVVVPLLTRHGGHANKFIGDGVLAVFGAPERLPDHADRALGAACGIAAAVEERWGPRLQVGVGINSGPVSAGSIGGGGRLEFTVIGDTVNVAARVEGVTRETGDSILLTEATRCLLTQGGIELQPRGSVPMRGRSEEVRLWAPLRRHRPGGPAPRATQRAGGSITRPDAGRHR
jgi:class 3 adenylate cyclase